MCGYLNGGKNNAFLLGKAFIAIMLVFPKNVKLPKSKVFIMFRKEPFKIPEKYLEIYTGKN